MRITLLSCDSGWYVLVLNGVIYYEGDEIPSYVWLDLLSDCDCTTSTKEISNRAMEHRTFEKKLKKL